MDSTLGSIVATITIAFLYFVFRRNSQPIFKKNKQQLLELIPIVVFCIFFLKVIKIAIIFLVVEIILYIIDYRNEKKKSTK